MSQGVEPNGAASTDDTAIRETPGVCGGYPCIADMRFPVRVVVQAHRELGSVERILAAYPQLSSRQVTAALEYYAKHPERVDEDIETNARAFEEIAGRAWPA
jgi:uncharacterized protein (DUF433 family)